MESDKTGKLGIRGLSGFGRNSENILTHTREEPSVSVSGLDGKPEQVWTESATS